MNELEEIYRNYFCEQNYDLANDIYKYFKTTPSRFVNEIYIKNHLSIFFSMHIKIWRAYPGEKYRNKGKNPNVNYVLIPEDNKAEIHILIYKGEIVRIKAWDLHEKGEH